MRLGGSGENCVNQMWWAAENFRYSPDVWVPKYVRNWTEPQWDGVGTCHILFGTTVDQLIFYLWPIGTVFKELLVSLCFGWHSWVSLRNRTQTSPIFHGFLWMCAINFLPEPETHFCGHKLYGRGASPIFGPMSQKHWPSWGTTSQNPSWWTSQDRLRTQPWWLLGKGAEQLGRCLAAALAADGDRRESTGKEPGQSVRIRQVSGGAKKTR